MNDFDPLLNYSINGKATHTELVLGLESVRNEITARGMSKELYYRAEAIAPGVMSTYGIDVRKLTVNHSENGRKVAVEAIDIAGAAAGAAAALGTGGAIAVGAVLAGGIGYALYRFYKFIRERFGKSKKEPSDNPEKSGTASAATGNYTSQVEKISMPTDDESKKIFEEKTAGKDSKALRGIISHAIACGKKFEMQPATIAALCDRVIEFMGKGDGALPLLYELLKKKENVSPVWLVKDLFDDGEVNLLVAYNEWVCNMIPLVAKPLEDTSTLDQRVAEIIKQFEAGGVRVTTAEFGSKEEGFMAKMLARLKDAMWIKKSKSLREIIEGKNINGVSQQTDSTLGEISKGGYSIYAGLTGSGLSTSQKAISGDEFAKLMDVFNQDSTGVRREIYDAIVTMVTHWGAVATELSKSDFTEDDAKNMATLKADGKTDVGMAYSVLAQAITTHANYALRTRNTFDRISSVLDDISHNFRVKANDNA